MSRVIDASEEPVTFFTCTTPGVFCLSFYAPVQDEDFGQVWKGDELLQVLDEPLDFMIILLNTDEQLKYNGPGTIVSGFRQGDEF